MTPIKKSINRPPKPIAKPTTIIEYRPLYINTKDAITLTTL